MGRSKTGRNNPQPLRSGMSTEGLEKEGNEPEGQLRTLRSRRQYLTVRRTLGFRIDGLESEQHSSISRSLFKLDTWPRLRDSKGDAGGSFVCAPAFENQNQIHYSGLDRRPRDPPIVGRCQPGRDRATLLAS